MNDLKALLKLIFCITLVFVLIACGKTGEDTGGHNGHGGGAYTVGGTVSGLEGTGLVLLYNVSDYLTITGDGAFVFNTTVANGEAYNVEVVSQPTSPAQTCTVNNGTGTIQGADVTDVTVICSGLAYTVGGTATGVNGGSVVLQNNGGDNLPLTSDGTFTFGTPVANTAGYDVTILSSPGLGCALANATGTVNGANITDVALSCIPVTVSALYPTNGADWNDYVKNDGGAITNATDTACVAASDTSCLHGGEMRVVEVPGEVSCAVVTMSEALGAFDWVCDDSTGSVRFISTGLADGKNLSDLIDFASTAWKKDSVTITTGAGSFMTLPAEWWSNPVTVDNDGGYLDTAGTIYMITNDVDLVSSGEGYIINATSVGLVGQPGVIINGPGLSADVISADTKDFLWIEGDMDADGDNHVLYLTSVRFSMLRNITADNAFLFGFYILDSSYNSLNGVAISNSGDSGILFDTSSFNTLNGIMVSNNGALGIELYNSSGNTLSGITASNNGIEGVYIASSEYNALSEVTVSNNGNNGIFLYTSSNSTLSNVTTSNNGNNGIYIDSSSNNNALSDVTASNNGAAGVYIYTLSSGNVVMGVTASNNATMGVEVNANANYNTLVGVAAANNSGHGIYVNNSWYATISNVAASNNNLYGVDIGSSSYNYFTGLLKVGSNSSDCLVSGGTNPGLVNTTCSTAGTYGSGGPGGYDIVNSSDATLYNGVTLADSFVAEVSLDSVNANGATGTAIYNSITDWTNFENAYRGWGLSGSAIFPDSSNQGVCGSGDTCQIWDWSLAEIGDTGDRGSPALLNTLGLPAGDDTLVHLWSANVSTCADIPGAIWGPACSLPGYSDSVSCTTAGGDWATDKCYSVFLRNAVEISGDGRGNDNLLCESDEKCLFTPNIGSYQGHGNLVSAGNFTNGALTGIELWEYDTNGR